MNSANDLGYTESSGNVFADLGIADPEDALAKAELARQISALIDERHLTKARAGEILGIDPANLSALMRGSLREISIDRLLRFLLALDRDVEIVIRPRGGVDGRVSVIAVA